MLIRPYNFRVVESNRFIEKAVEDTLAACDVYEPPTPLERLFEYRRLTPAERAGRIPGKMVRLFRKYGRRIAGILDLRARIVGTSPLLHPHRRRFLGFHELGHEVIEWHRETFVITSEWDLQPDVRSQLEAEANHFASLTIFQPGDLARIHRGRQLHAKDLPRLASRYDASLTATARHYIGAQDSPAVLLVSSRASGRFGYGVGNDLWLRQFGELPPDDLKRAVQDHAGQIRIIGSVAEGEAMVADRRGDQRHLAVETLFNGYHLLTLVHPTRSVRRLFGVSSLRHITGKTRAA